MIYCKNKNDLFLLDDELNIKGTSKAVIDFIEILIDNKRKDFKPENGSPTYIVAEELKKNGFEIVDVDLPFDEQLDGQVF